MRKAIAFILMVVMLVLAVGADSCIEKDNSRSINTRCNTGKIVDKLLELQEGQAIAAIENVKDNEKKAEIIEKYLARKYEIEVKGSENLGECSFLGYENTRDSSANGISIKCGNKNIVINKYFKKRFSGFQVKKQNNKVSFILIGKKKGSEENRLMIIGTNDISFDENGCLKNKKLCINGIYEMKANLNIEVNGNEITIKDDSGNLAVVSSGNVAIRGQGINIVPEDGKEKVELKLCIRFSLKDCPDATSSGLRINPNNDEISSLKNSKGENYLKVGKTRFTEFKRWRNGKISAKEIKDENGVVIRRFNGDEIIISKDGNIDSIITKEAKVLATNQEKSTSFKSKTDVGICFNKKDFKKEPNCAVIVNTKKQAEPLKIKKCKEQEISCFKGEILVRAASPVDEYPEEYQIKCEDKREDCSIKKRVITETETEILDSNKMKKAVLDACDREMIRGCSVEENGIYKGKLLFETETGDDYYSAEDKIADFLYGRYKIDKGKAFEAIRECIEKGDCKTDGFDNIYLDMNFFEKYLKSQKALKDFTAIKKGTLKYYEYCTEKCKNIVEMADGEGEKKTSADKRKNVERKNEQVGGTTNKGEEKSHNAKTPSGKDNNHNKEPPTKQTNVKKEEEIERYLKEIEDLKKRIKSKKLRNAKLKLIEQRDFLERKLVTLCSKFPDKCNDEKTRGIVKEAKAKFPLADLDGCTEIGIFALFDGVCFGKGGVRENAIVVDNEFKLDQDKHGTISVGGMNYATLNVAGKLVLVRIFKDGRVEVIDPNKSTKRKSLCVDADGPGNTAYKLKYDFGKQKFVSTRKLC